MSTRRNIHDSRKGGIILFEETGDGLLLTPLRHLAETNPEKARAFM